MIKNKIHYILKQNIDEILSSEDFVILFDGKKIRNKNELFSFLEETMDLPDSDNWSSLIDWLTDLSWLKADKYAFVFDNYNSFLADDFVSKELFLEILKEDVLPWWENDAKKYVVGGVAKSFQVYIIKND
ncbi:barstar family protein [Streptococcus sp. oral taxon 431]|uniref:barstar family protein n=1 Tax=Streptococcus sp. oral taxon 431 TaxID=712633 RepID=UPI000AA48A3B|nr:barstar family protein [Streptococcus sp. oral taxon 431]